LVVLERAHLFELLFDPTASFDREFKQPARSSSLGSPLGWMFFTRPDTVRRTALRSLAFRCEPSEK